MLDIYGGITLPAPSRAERDVPLASAGHCTANAVLGSNEGFRSQAESWLELSHQLLLNAKSNVSSFQEQVYIYYGWNPKKQSKHIFDVIATMTDGSKIAYTIKPERGLVSGRFLNEMQEIAWWVREKDFADEVRLLTDNDIDRAELNNARIFAAVREPDPEADEAALRAVKRLHGARSLHDLSTEIGMQGRGYSALLRLLRRDFLRLLSHEAITPGSFVALA